MTLTVAQAAKECGVSLRTVRRWLAAGELEGAHRDTEGRWQIPPGAIVGRARVSVTDERPDAVELAAARDELAELRTALAVERAQRESLELLAAERLARAEAAERRAEQDRINLREALRALPSGEPAPSSETLEVVPRGRDTPDAPRRRWWNRG